MLNLIHHLTFYWNVLIRDTYAGGQEGQELPFILNSFHLSYLVKGIFRRFRQVGVEENFSGSKPPDPQLTML